MWDMPSSRGARGKSETLSVLVADYPGVYPKMRIKSEGNAARALSKLERPDTSGLGIQ